MTRLDRRRLCRGLAALLLAVSLGLPWGQRPTWVPGPSTPFTIQLWNGVGGGYCCLSVTTSTSSSQLAMQTMTGAEHPARFGLVAALVLLALPQRRARLVAAAVVAAELLISGGAGFTAGGVAAAWLAVLLLGAGQLATRRPAA